MSKVTNKPFTKDQSDFLKKLIDSGDKSRHECIEEFNKKFPDRNFSDRGLRHFQTLNKLNFKQIQPDAWSENEEAVLKGLWLIDASVKRRIIEIPNRGAKAMRSKLNSMKLVDKVNESMRKQIEGEIKQGVSLNKISKEHKIDIKFLKEFVSKVKETTVEFENLSRWENADTDDIWETLIAKQKNLKKLDSEQEFADIKINSNAKYIALTIFSDFHLENKNTDLEQLRDDFNTVKDTPNFFAGFNGDLIDNFTAGPHPEGVLESILPPKEARMLAGKLFEALNQKEKKMLWMVLGCHDAWDKDHSDYDLPQHIARKLGIYYLGAGGDINLKVNDIVYYIHSRHKYRGSSGLVNGTACCKKIVNELDSKFDIVAVSHNHIAEIKSEFFLGKQRCWIRTGSYKREDRYSKRMGYRGNEYNIQIPVVILNTEKKEMKIVNGISNAADLLKALNKTK